MPGSVDPHVPPAFKAGPVVHGRHGWRRLDRKIGRRGNPSDAKRSDNRSHCFQKTHAIPQMLKKNPTKADAQASPGAGKSHCGASKSHCGFSRAVPFLGVSGTEGTISTQNGPECGQWAMMAIEWLHR